VAIVTDGSARWAHANGLSMSDGYEAAADTVIATIGNAIELGIEELALYAFSTENWTRPNGEVRAVLEMLARRIAADAPELHARDVRVRFIGRRDRAGEQLVEHLEHAERLTAHNHGLLLHVALDYGGRDEIVSAARRFEGGSEEDFAKLLHAPEMHDPDLVIRTSGEQRLSNFLLWQAAYSELVFRPELWPDFGLATLCVLRETLFERRRRFGGRAIEAR
jgi:undecaprenyl diphosphate synthase